MENIRKKLELDYENAIISNSNIMKYALDELIHILNNLNNDNLIFEKMENIVEEKGQKVIRGIRKNKLNIIEKDIFAMNVHNQYLSTFKYKKNRRIILKTSEDDQIEENWKNHLEAEPKVISVKNIRFIDKINNLFK